MGFSLFPFLILTVNMEITIKENTIKLRQSFKALMMYENITNDSFSIKGITEIITYFYCVVLASKKEIDLTYDDFLEWLDNNPQAVKEFTEWILAESKIQETIAKK